MTSNDVGLALDSDRHAIADARRILADIPECYAAHYSVRHLNGAPVLVVAFSLPGTEHKPACAIRLVTVSLSEPLKPGARITGERLRRHVRDSIENYLAKHGIKIPTYEG